MNERMTREEYHAQQRARSDMDPEAFDRAFATWPCWCGARFCPGWQTLTWRELEILVASSPNLGHMDGFLEMFSPVPDESRR